VSRSAFRKLVREAKARAGIARAGWNAGVTQLGGNIQWAWVARHGGGYGDLTIDDGPDRIALLSTNRVTYASRFTQLYGHLPRKRDRDVQFHLQKRLDQLAARV
jgi:hypothetical protein